MEENKKFEKAKEDIRKNSSKAIQKTGWDDREYSYDNKKDLQKRIEKTNEG